MNEIILTTGERDALIGSVVATLNQGEALLQEIDDEAYTRSHPAAFNASIGGHYRHCLDHFQTLLASAGGDELNYDHRERGTLIETDRFAALNATRDLSRQCRGRLSSCVERNLAVTCKTSYSSAGSQTAMSTVGREIMYAVAHAIHHYALIGVMCALMGVPLPQGFGVAPSTVRHHSDREKVGH